MLHSNAPGEAFEFSIVNVQLVEVLQVIPVVALPRITPGAAVYPHAGKITRKQIAAIFFMSTLRAPFRSFAGSCQL